MLTVLEVCRVEPVPKQDRSDRLRELRIQAQQVLDEGLCILGQKMRDAFTGALRHQFQVVLDGDTSIARIPMDAAGSTQHNASHGPR